LEKAGTVIGGNDLLIAAHVPQGFQAVQCGQAQAICVYKMSPAAGVIYRPLSQAYFVKDTGIYFSIATNPPPGYPANNAAAYQWVQVVRQHSTTAVNDNGRRNVGCNPATTTCAGLDNTYPYPLSPPLHAAYDAPGAGLTIPGQAELDDVFGARMYLLWDPSLNASGVPNQGCAAASSAWDPVSGLVISTASTCMDATTGNYYSIPVPIGYVDWGYCGDAINTFVDQPPPQGVNLTTTFKLNCAGQYGSPGAGPEDPVYTRANGTSSFPTWKGVVGNTAADEN
jgi:hypothetical protein